jgi:hypothetical protein
MKIPLLSAMKLTMRHELILVEVGKGLVEAEGGKMTL